VQQVLIDGYSRKNPKDLSGRTANNRVINFNGASDLIGNFVNVLVSEALPNSLRGTLVSADVAES
jgi:tRNA-2-methylthio-N6-dimethylallyladenosine synthase